MKIGHVVLVLILVAIAGALVWNFAPGCRQRAMDAYRQYGGWTEEARRADPVGFIEYAEGELRDDLQEFEATRGRLSEANATVSSELERTRELLAAAEELAGEFRAAYRSAEGAGADAGYPVDVQGREYARSELMTQVRVILKQRASYRDIIEGFERAAEDVKETEETLVTQIVETRAALSMLPSRREIARINELTGRTEELLGQVNELIDQNRTVMGETPVRTVEELVQAREQAAAPSDEEEVDVLAFLEGEE